MNEMEQSKIILYATDGGNVIVSVSFFDDKRNELDEKATTRKIRVLQQEGNRQVRRDVTLYNLDVIIAVG